MVVLVWAIGFASYAAPHLALLRVTLLVCTSGPVLVTAIVAGTQAVKATSTLIPFCHPLPIDGCKFECTVVSHLHSTGETALQIRCGVRCTAKTGVEMEALTGASVAALTVYDMLKAISHDIVITDTRLLAKRGGKSEYIRHGETSDEENF
jgi:cyclic pyranopterin phosphate synthase